MIESGKEDNGHTYTFQEVRWFELRKQEVIARAGIIRKGYCGPFRTMLSEAFGLY